ncbi:MAG: hypothetical protein RBR97_19630 [Bacteroidales bacterium]|nr:hypothetical protein [Bacteroidales bacterium]
MRTKILTTYILLISTLLIGGCTGMAKDIFVGNVAGTYDSWDRPNCNNDCKTKDVSYCMHKSFPFKNGKPIETTSNIYMLNTYAFEQCMLDKGYKFYPRGIDGKSASTCTNDDGKSPAYKSVPLGGNLKF